MPKNTRSRILTGLGLLAIMAVFFRWFTNNLLTSGDWQYIFAYTSKDWLRVPQAWDPSSLGSTNISASTWPFTFLYSLFGSAHLSSAVADKLVFMLPIILVGPLGSYILARKLKLGRLPGVVAAVVYCLNTYALILATGQLTVLAGYSFAPIILAYFIQGLETKSVRPYVISGLLGFISSFYEFRMTYITVSVLILYGGFHFGFKFRLNKQILKDILLACTPIAIIVLANLYWLIGIAFTGSLSDNSIFARGLFGNDFLNTRYALSFFHPFWTDGAPAVFHNQPIPFYAWLVPALAFSTLMLRIKQRRYVVSFAIIALLGILLTKQVAPPFPGLYNWLYIHFPGFNAYREASKFYELIGLGYSVLLALLVDWLCLKIKTGTAQMKYLSLAIVVAIFSVFFINTKPLITGSVETLFVGRHMPSDYQRFESYISKQKTPFRTLWVPVASRWTAYNQIHPKSSLTDVTSGNFSPFFSQTNNSFFIPSQSQLANTLKHNYTPDLLNAAGYKYIVVPTRDSANDDDFFINYGDDRQFYINTLNSLPWLKRVDINTKELAVYINTSYSPYIASTDKLYSISSLDSLDQIRSFTSTQLKQESFSFISDPAPSQRNQYSIRDFFGDLSKNNLNGSALNLSLKTDDSKSLKIYADNNRPQINYTIQNNNISFFAKKLAGPNIQDKSTSLVSGSSQDIGSTGLDTNKQYYVNTGNNLLRVDANRQNRNLGIVSAAPVLMSAASENLVSNPSLEKGLWQPKLSDCNDYDNNATISQAIDTKVSHGGQQSLRLEADKHIACTGPNVVPGNPGSKYLFSFDYKVEGGRQAGYSISYIGSKVKPFEKELDVGDTNWRQETTMITIPTDATGIKLTLKGYPDDQLENHAVTHYDNLRLSVLTETLQTQLDTTSHYTQTALKSTKQLKIRYTDKDYNYKNVISNPSLEKGLWQQKVGDCHNFDDQPDIGMRLSDKATDGTKSLQLEARHHTACTGPPSVPVQENSKYLLSFDYQSPNGKAAGYYVSFNDSSHTVISQQLPIKDTRWNALNKTITVPYGATSLKLTVYAYSNDSGGQNIINRYDGFYLTRVPDITNQYYLYSAPKNALQKPKNINFHIDSPTHKTISVQGAKSAFYLTMNEAYHPNWQLSIKGTSASIADSNHLKFDDFSNAWYIDVPSLCSKTTTCSKNKDGSYNIALTATFSAQKYFNIGLTISGVALITCIYFIVSNNRKRVQFARTHFKGWRFVGYDSKHDK